MTGRVFGSPGTGGPENRWQHCRAVNASVGEKHEADVLWGSANGLSCDRAHAFGGDSGVIRSD